MRRSLGLGLLLVACATTLQAGEFIWIEGESPAQADFKWEAKGSRAGMLSAEKWLVGQEKTWTDQGFTVSYTADAPKAGPYTLWLRIGFEWCRPKVTWRVNEGKWTTVGLGGDEAKRKSQGPGIDRHQQTTNVKELGYWADIGWWNLGTADLKAGKNTVTLRFTKACDNRVLISLDALALVQGAWIPEGRLKPGETYQGEEDKKAAAQVFELPAPKTTADRTAVELTGLWQVARFDDPDMDQAPYEPVQALPSPAEYKLRWLGIRVPMPLSKHKETGFAHRVIYRTQVKVPAELNGRGFKLHFQGTNWIVSVFVNGQLAGTHRGVFVAWDMDISRFVKPGAVNEIAVAVKSCYYAMDTDAMKRGDLDMNRNIPVGALRHRNWIAPIYPSSKGDGQGTDYGIVNPVSLVAVGNAYADDIFIKTSVAHKELVAEVTVRNTAAAAREFQVQCEAIDDKDNTAAKTFGPVPIKVPAGSTALVTVKGGWADPKLWWPTPDPHLYRLRTTILENGKPLDMQETLFGFREITIDGIGFRLNGVRRNFWNWASVRANNPKDAAAVVKRYHAELNRFTRFSSGRVEGQFERSREERLTFYDRQGLPGRLCSMIDGMFITYVLAKNEPDPADPKKRRWVLNQPVWDGFKRHLVQMVKAYRNHPSVLMYQAENELVYINGQNRYGGAMDIIQQAMADCIEAARKQDPTRSFQVGGAGDLGGRIETHCVHYPAGYIDWYPQNAYRLEKTSNHTQRWPWKKDKPFIAGESAFAKALEYGAAVAGDEVFRSTNAARRGKAKYIRMLYGGYRWAGVAAFHPWDNLSEFEDGLKAFHPLCVIPRKQTHRLRAGQENKLLFKAMNDTLEAKPISLSWTYTIGDKVIAQDEKQLNIEPGFGQEYTVVINAPATQKRLEGTLTLNAAQPGNPLVYKDVRQIPVLPPVGRLALKTPLLLLDRSKRMAAHLQALGLSFTPITMPADLKGKKGLLVVGPDTLTEREALQPDILAFALDGGRVIVLEQTNPLSGNGLPTRINTSDRPGGYAFPQALGKPVFQDLGQDDLIDWAGDHPTFQASYWKPAYGAKSLAQAGEQLQFSPLLEVGCGEGIMALCQLRVGAKLGVEPAADILFRNLLRKYDTYKPAAGRAAVFAPEAPIIARKLGGAGLQLDVVTSLAAALDTTQYRVALVHADQANLEALARMRPKLEAFQQAGGWVMLMGLAPKALPAFNTLLGTHHMLRPFRVERVTLTGAQIPVAAMLGNRDVALYSGRVIQHGKIWVSGNTFSYVIDNLDVAPFARMPDGPAAPYEYKPQFHDSDPYNFVNGMLASDHWRYIRQVGVKEGPDGANGSKPRVFTLRRPETIAQINIWNNIHYHTTKDMDIIFDGDKANAMHVTLPDSGVMTEIKLPEPRTVEKTIALQTITWRDKANREDFPQLVGIDNVQFLRATQPPKAVFLDSVGGLVAFPHGKGGFFLNQIKFMDKEPNPVNDGKKTYLTSLLLQNMGVGSKAAAVAVAGHNIKYETVDVTKHCTHFLWKKAEKGAPLPWFGLHPSIDLSGMQKGEQHLAHVLYHVVDYSTAPVPDVLMIRSQRAGRNKKLPTAIEGIPIGKKADVLFFLQAADIRGLHKYNELPKLKTDPDALPEVARYVLHYTDGKTAEIPVLSERHVTNYLQTTDEPKLLEGADVAWSGPVKYGNYKIQVVYSMKAVNPRPDVEIQSLDIVEGHDARGRPSNRGAFAVLAITLGHIIE